MADDGFVAQGAHHHRTCVSFFGCHLIHSLECELEVIALMAVKNRQCAPALPSSEHSMKCAWMKNAGVGTQVPDVLGAYVNPPLERDTLGPVAGETIIAASGLR